MKQTLIDAIYLIGAILMFYVTVVIIMVVVCLCLPMLRFIVVSLVEAGVPVKGIAICAAWITLAGCVVMGCIELAHAKSHTATPPQ